MGYGVRASFYSGFPLGVKNNVDAASCVQVTATLGRRVPAYQAGSRTRTNTGLHWERGQLMSSSKVVMASEKTPSEKTPAEINTELRTLAHDLSNAIETIMQATYLLGTAKIDDNAKKWLELIDKASRDAARINRDIREHLRAQTTQISPQ
jgi:hypothetical protein